MREEYFSNIDLQQLQGLAEKWSKLFKPGDWISLKGEMGAGKTTFVRTLLAAWHYDEPVQSPTFPLLIEYDLAHAKVIHIDGFRLNNSSELPWNESDWKDEILLVEWADKIPSFLPRFNYEIEIQRDAQEESQRSIALRTLKR